MITTSACLKIQADVLFIKQYKISTNIINLFFMKYLWKVGFQADNQLFGEHPLYFRNVLVRVNDNNLKVSNYETI